MTGTSTRALELIVGGRPISAQLRESHRARRLRLVVRPGCPLEVTVPRGTGSRALRRFLDEHSRWIIDRLDEAAERAAGPRALGPAEPGTLVLAGKPIRVVRVPGARPTATCRRGVLQVSGTDPTAAIGRWYRREARRLLEQAAATEAERLGLAFARIAVRDQRTRWGSCSTRGTLSFSWRLALAPPEILHYVVVHELLHLREHNHSRAFWALLDTHRPSWRAEAGWLHEHGRELQEYDPGSALSR